MTGLVERLRADAEVFAKVAEPYEKRGDEHGHGKKWRSYATNSSEAADRIEQLELLYNATLESFTLARGQDQARIKELEAKVAAAYEECAELCEDGTCLAECKCCRNEKALAKYIRENLARAALKVEP